jgi:MOSC domain-containing protein YiiM
MIGKIISINVSQKKSEKKKPVIKAILLKEHGIEGDAHAGSDRQLSLLALESIQKMGDQLKPGDFAENLTTVGIDFGKLSVGMRLKVGGEAVIELTKFGKECHAPCNIFKTHGYCIMPKEGVFARVISGGNIRCGDPISI